MKKQVVKTLIAGLLTFSMVCGTILQPTTETQAVVYAAKEDENALGLTWPDNMKQFHEWVFYGSNPEKTKANVIKALNEEYARQKQDESFDIGEIQETVIYSWNGLPAIQLNGGDNVSNPWGQTGRKWALIVAPYEGMAFTIKGKFAEGCNNLIPAANEFTYAGKTWQMFTDCIKFIENGELKGWGFNPGSGSSGNCAEAFDKAYSQSAWYNEAMEQPWHLGYTGNVQREGNIIYQKFEGNLSNGVENNQSGISYLVAQNAAATEVYLITHDMFNAWHSTWISNDKKFANSGVPLGNQYVTEDGEIAQDFENFTLVLTDDVNDPWIIQAKAEIADFTIAGGETIQSGNNIVVFVPASSDVKNLKPTFKVTKEGIVDKQSGTAQNFSNPVTYTVTSETGAEYPYNVTVVATDDTKITKDSRQSAAIYANKMKLLNNPLTLGDEETIAYLEEEFWKASGAVKYLIKEQYQSLTDKKAELDTLKEEEAALKVACVGDSITELSPNYVVPLAELFDSNRVAFNNYGVSGYCLSTKASEVNLSYWNTNKFAQSKALNPDVVTIMLGTNDADAGRWEKLGFKDTFETDLRTMVQEFRDLESHPEVVIIASPGSWPIDDYRANVIRDEINPIKKRVAEEMGCIYVDIHTLTDGDQSMLRDGLHPSNKGTQVMANAIAEAFRTGIIGTGVSEISLDGVPIEAAGQYERILWDFSKDFPELTVKTENGSEAVVEHTPTTEEPYYVFKVAAKVGNYARKYMVEFGEKLEEKKSENTENNGGSVAAKVKVKTIQISGISKKIAVGESIDLEAKVTPKNATDKSLTYKSSNSKYASVDKNGRVTVKKAGKNKKVTITATANDGSGVSAKYQISIMPKVVKKITIKSAGKTIKNNATIKVKAGKKLKLKAIVSPSKNVNKTISWSSSNKKYATVKNGTVTTKKAGKNKKVIITAAAVDGSGKKVKIKIWIK